MKSHLWTMLGNVFILIFFATILKEEKKNETKYDSLWLLLANL